VAQARVYTLAAGTRAAQQQHAGVHSHTTITLCYKVRCSLSFSSYISTVYTCPTSRDAASSPRLSSSLTCTALAPGVVLPAVLRKAYPSGIVDSAPNAPALLQSPCGRTRCRRNQHFHPRLLPLSYAVETHASRTLACAMRMRFLPRHSL
jgi:hypothetical protein